MFTNTLYINLRERTDRLAHVVAELQKMGIENATRIEAIKNVNGAIGCSLSHIRSLMYAREKGWEHVFICEDDITFLQPDVLQSSLNKFVGSTIANHWDVLIIGGNNCPPYTMIEDYCCKVSNCQTTTGYIVKRHYYDTLIANFRESVRNLMREPQNGQLYALDIYWKRLQQTDEWYMILPPTVTQYENYSDIERKNTNYNWLMLDIEKKWLFRK
jgi:glycosyl transferase family 25